MPTESVFGTLRVPDTSDVESALRAVIAAAGGRVAVHCCAADAPLRMFRAAGAAAVGVDLTLGGVNHDDLGELVEAGTALWLGAIPALGPGFRPRRAQSPIRCAGCGESSDSHRSGSPSRLR